jgi:hypothetical protein
MFARNIEQAAAVLEKEVMMVTDVGVEIGASGIHHHLTQHPCLDELLQRIVDGRERHPDRGLDRFAVQLLLLSGFSYLLAEVQGARPLSESRCTPDVSLVVMPISMAYSSVLVDALFITATVHPSV